MAKSRQIQPIPFIVEYFGSTESPIVTQEYRPGKGWVRTNFRKRISASWARKLKGEGVTSVALTLGERTADFQIEELLNSLPKLDHVKLSREERNDLIAAAHKYARKYDTRDPAEISQGIDHILFDDPRFENVSAVDISSYAYSCALFAGDKNYW